MGNMASSFLTSALDGGHLHAPVESPAPRGDRTIDTHWVRGVVNPRALLDAIEEGKSVALVGNRTLGVETYSLLAEATELLKRKILRNILMTF
jgi:hypothetical protein